MHFWKLSQVKDRDSREYAHTMIVRAETEKEARILAQANERINRDGEIAWIFPEFATCEALSIDGEEGIILVA